MHLVHVPRRLIGVTAVACAAALTPAAALAASSSPATSPAPVSTPRCATSGLVAWLNVPPGNHYAGGAYYYLEFTNLSGHTCTFRGSPGVWAVSLSGGTVGSRAGWGVARPATVGLAPGATATSILQVANPANFGSRCFLPGSPAHLPTAAGLRVHPPNQFL